MVFIDEFEEFPHLFVDVTSFAACVQVVEVTVFFRCVRIDIDRVLILHGDDDESQC